MSGRDPGGRGWRWCVGGEGGPHWSGVGPRGSAVMGMCTSSGKFCTWDHDCEGLWGCGGAGRKRGLSPRAAGCRLSGGMEEPAHGPVGRKVQTVTRVPAERRSEGRLGRREELRLREGPLSVRVVQASPPG